MSVTSLLAFSSSLFMPRAALHEHERHGMSMNTMA
jgi:hypothetical protein